MNAPWTDYLVAPLAERLRGRDWLRVDVSRGGGWNLLEARSEGSRWHHLESAEADLLPLSALADRGLPQLGSVVSGFLDGGYSVNLLAHKCLFGKKVCIYKFWDKYFSVFVFHSFSALLDHFQHLSLSGVSFNFLRVQTNEQK